MGNNSIITKQITGEEGMDIENICEDTNMVEKQVAEALHHFTKTVPLVTSSQLTSSAHISVHHQTTFNCGCKFPDGQPCIGALDPQG